VGRTTKAIAWGAATMLTAAVGSGCGGTCQDNDMVCAPAPVFSIGPGDAGGAAADAAGGAVETGSDAATDAASAE